GESGVVALPGVGLADIDGDLAVGFHHHAGTVEARHLGEAAHPPARRPGARNLGVVADADAAILAVHQPILRLGGAEGVVADHFQPAFERGQIAAGVVAHADDVHIGKFLGPDYVAPPHL